jgi:hypothetical protein
MSERIIPISPYTKADSLIDLSGYISVDSIKETIDIPKRKQLILYKYSLSNDNALIPRNHKSLKICLKPNLISGYEIDDFSHLLTEGEVPVKILKLILQVSCKTTRWCSDQYFMNLSEVNGLNQICFEIPISEIKGDIDVTGFVVRMFKSKINEPRKANSAFAVVSDCEEIQIQIDELKEIGGNHLPIDFEDLVNKNMVFDIEGLDNDYEIPRIKCAKEFQEFFVNDNLNTVNSAFMMAMFYFLDSYFKWLIFKCKYDQHDKNHRGLVNLFSKYCTVSKAELIELIQETKYSENQSKTYLSLSHKLFYGIQVNSPIKYSREFKQIIKEELR